MIAAVEASTIVDVLTDEDILRVPNGANQLIEQKALLFVSDYDYRPRRNE